MREREVRLGSGVYAMRYWGEHGVIKPWRYRKGGQGGGGRRWNWRREWKSKEGVETGVNCREWQSGVGKHGRGGVRSVCYAVGIKQCPPREMPPDADADVVSLCYCYRRCYGAVGAEAAFSGKRKKRSGCSRQSIYMYTNTYICISFCIYVYACIHRYVRTEKIFWTCTSRGSSG